nr:hypothetical protein [Tanacetum cinerariifolium]
MDQDSAYMVAASKVPMLKPCEYELWRMWMEQYIQMLDYSLWDVMENGNAPPISQVVEGVETIIAPAIAKEKAQRRLELKARSTLLMGIPIEHQFKFNSTKDVESLLQAVEKKYLTRRCQSEVLKSLSPEWNTHTIVWRNKPEINTLSLDDLYNNLKIYEPKVKGTSSSNTNTQNVAFLSSNNTSSTNEGVNTAHDVTTANTQAIVVNSTTIDNLSDAVICSFFASQPISPQLDNGDLQQIYSDDLKEMDLRSPRNQKNKNRESTKIVPVETPASSALVSCDGLGGLESIEARLLVYKENESIYEKDIKLLIREIHLRELRLEAKASTNKPKDVRKNFGLPLIEDWISDSEDEAESKSKIEKETVKPSFAKIKFVKSKEQVKSSRKTTVKQIMKKLMKDMLLLEVTPKE